SSAYCAHAGDDSALQPTSTQEEIHASARVIGGCPGVMVGLYSDSTTSFELTGRIGHCPLPRKPLLSATVCSAACPRRLSPESPRSDCDACTRRGRWSSCGATQAIPCAESYPDVSASAPAFPGARRSFSTSLTPAIVLGKSRCSMVSQEPRRRPPWSVRSSLFSSVISSSPCWARNRNWRPT